MAASTQFMLPATSRGHIGCMFSKLVAVLLPNSPVSARNGLPSTINCVAVPCFCKCGMPVAVCPQHGTVVVAAQHASAIHAMVIDFMSINPK